MRRIRQITSSLVAVLLLASATSACVTAPPAGVATSAPQKGLLPFENDAALKRWLADWQRAHPQPPRERMMQAMAAPPPAAPMVAGAMAKVDSMSAATVELETITNVQTQGVDEGDIVKQSGDFLVVLRRGRLFTVRVGGDRLQAGPAVNAYAPNIDPADTWYDEMLVSAGRVVVIGYSYARGGTEVGLFDLDDEGRIAYRATYQMRSNDYYSSRDYASRLIGHTLVFYSPLQVNTAAADPFAGFPALRHWHGGATPADFQRILPATRVYRSAADVPADSLTLHSVSQCNLDAAVMTCESTAVLGPSGRVFYVSEDAVYVWTASWTDHSAGSASVFRIPLDGSMPRGLRASGSPVDQMSFLQRDGYLNVLLNRDGRGDGMWASNAAASQLALLRVPVADFGDGSAIAKDDTYRVLPITAGEWDLQNRFVGDWLLYGTPQATSAHALRYAAFAPVTELALGHGVQRIEAMGSDAILVGQGGADLHFSSVALRDDASVAARFVQTQAAQGDERTHGFFYKPVSATSGTVGLPIVSADGDAASVLFLHNDALHLDRVGTLASKASAQASDGCKASCVDWYGNARPIFLGDRVFALLGYEIVEGRLSGGGIGERRRVNFAPAAMVAR